MKVTLREKVRSFFFAKRANLTKLELEAKCKKLSAWSEKRKSCKYCNFYDRPSNPSTVTGAANGQESVGKERKLEENKPADKDTVGNKPRKKNRRFINRTQHRRLTRLKKKTPVTLFKNFSSLDFGSAEVDLLQKGG